MLLKPIHLKVLSWMITLEGHVRQEGIPELHFPELAIGQLTKLEFSDWLIQILEMVDRQLLF